MGVTVPIEPPPDAQAATASMTTTTEILLIHAKTTMRSLLYVSGGKTLQTMANPISPRPRIKPKRLPVKGFRPPRCRGVPSLDVVV
jgi:hypothetical protein